MAAGPRLARKWLPLCSYRTVLLDLSAVPRERFGGLDVSGAIRVDYAECLQSGQEAGGAVAYRSGACLGASGAGQRGDRAAGMAFTRAKEL